MNGNHFGILDFIPGVILGLLSAILSGLGALSTTLGNVVFEIFAQVVDN